jgi:Isochorismatase family
MKNPVHPILLLATALLVVATTTQCTTNGQTASGTQGTTGTAANQYTEKLSPQNSTLIMVDYLTGFDPGLKTIERKLYMNNVTAVAKLGKIFKLPTIVLGDEGGFRGNFYPVLAEQLPNAPRIARHTPSAWREPAFVKEVDRIGRKKLIMAGISIDNCLMQLALDALKAGYEVYVVVDASGSDEKLVEQAAMQRLTQAGAVMTSWVSLASELMGDWETPEGPAVGQIYQQHSAWGGNKQAGK